MLGIFSSRKEDEVIELKRKSDWGIKKKAVTEMKTVTVRRLG